MLSPSTKTLLMVRVFGIFLQTLTYENQRLNVCHNNERMLSSTELAEKELHKISSEPRRQPYLCPSRTRNYIQIIGQNYIAVLRKKENFFQRNFRDGIQARS